MELVLRGAGGRGRALVNLLAVLTVATSGALSACTAGSPPASQGDAPAATTTAAPDDGRVEVFGARVTLPSGWVVKPRSDFGDPLEVSEKSACLTPTATPPAGWQDCPVWLSTFEADGTLDPKLGVSYEEPRTAFQNVTICGAGNTEDQPTPRFRGGTRKLGDREAEWRSFVFTCSTTLTERYEQYVVPTLPGWVLSSLRATDEVSGSMSTIAADLQLPAGASPARIVDYGVITSLDSADGATLVTIDRTVGYEGEPGYERTGTRATYRMPAAAWTSMTAEQPVKVGEFVKTETDGENLTWVYN